MFCLAPLLVAAVTPTSDATIRISLSVNGLALSERPFLDHTHTWPPSITWKIEEMDISNTTEYNLRQASYDLHINGVYAGGQAGADMRHDIGTSPVSCVYMRFPLWLQQSSPSFCSTHTFTLILLCSLSRSGATVRTMSTFQSPSRMDVLLRHRASFGQLCLTGLAMLPGYQVLEYYRSRIIF